MWEIIGNFLLIIKFVYNIYTKLLLFTFDSISINFWVFLICNWSFADIVDNDGNCNELVFDVLVDVE